MLLEQAALVEVVPVIQYDWQAPFGVPWIPPAPEPSEDDGGVRVVPVPVTRSPGERLANIEEILSYEEWLRDPENKARDEALKVLAELTAPPGSATTPDSAP